jgi:hypothetical protein
MAESDASLEADVAIVPVTGLQTVSETAGPRNHLTREMAYNYVRRWH